MSSARRPRRVLVVLSMIFQVRGGIPRFNQLLCRALDELSPELNLEPVVVSQHDSLEDQRGSGQIWSRVRFFPGNGSKGSCLARAVSLSARLRPRALLIGHFGMSPIGLACAPFVRGGYGIVAHGTEAWVESRRLRLAAGRRARFVVAVSRDTGNAFCRLTGLPAERVRILPNALDPGFLPSPVDPEPTENADGPEILSVARLWAEEKMKGVDHTLEAMARLAPSHPILRYRIVGKGSDKPRLEALAATLGLGGRVRFEEDLSDEELAERYRRCTLFVLPSGQEGFGIVYLEAMRFSRAVVGATAGGIPEVVTDGVTGILVPFGDVAALSAALDRLLADPGLRREMGRKGRERVLSHFSYPRFRDTVRDILTEWLE